MKITKVGHCCLLIEILNKRILVDPGAWSTTQNTLHAIDVVLITHEHPDHLHIQSLHEIVKKNPRVQIASHGDVCTLLLREGIASMAFTPGIVALLSNIPVLPVEAPHEEIFEEIGRVSNMGYLLGEKIYIPGDSFTLPPFAVDILALPIAGPWLSFKQAMRFALAICPRIAFPIHDGMIDLHKLQMLHRVPVNILGKEHITFIPLEEGASFESEQDVHRN